MKHAFYRAVLLVDGLALFLDAGALVDFVLHPLGLDYNFHSALYRAVTVLVMVPITLLVAGVIIRRVPGNVVGPLLIAWSGTVAYNSVRVEIGPALFGLYYAYDLIFGWFALFLMLLHFPDGTIQPARAGRWIYRLLVFNFLANLLIFVSTDTLSVPSGAANVYLVPSLLPYHNVFLSLGLLFITPMLVLTPISFVLRYRRGSPLERQQIKWLALLGGFVAIYTILEGIVVPLLTGVEVMTIGTNLPAVIFFMGAGLLPAVVIGIAMLRYRLWDIDHIIRRTLVYSLVTIILSLVYLGSVLVLQTTFSFLFQLGSNDLAIVISTLAIAALFVPLRGRIQRAIDQQFFRQKYDAEQTLARFAATARSEVMLEPLASALVSNVEETMHPEGVSLWLLSSAGKQEPAGAAGGRLSEHAQQHAA